MPNYQNGKIYKITSCHLPNVCYIGSTVQTLKARMRKHRADYNALKEGKGLFVSSFEIVCFPDAIITLLHNFPCASKKELEREEGEQMIKYGIENIINKNIAGRTKKEYLEVNKERIKLRSKAYREENKERLSATKQKYYQENKERRRAYKKANKHIILAPTPCPLCSSVITKLNMRTHQKTKKCLKAQAVQTNE